MKLIVITQPEFFEDEAAAITSLFDAGLEILAIVRPFTVKYLGKHETDNNYPACIL